MLGWSVDSGTPLIGHSAGDAGIGLGTLLPAGWTGTEFVLATGGLIGPPTGCRQRQDVGGYQRREVLEPETGALARVISELIWLYDLSGFADTSVDSTYWILYCYTGGVLFINRWTNSSASSVSLGSRRPRVVQCMPLPQR